ncbi:MAG: hypothetical protein ACREJ5_24150 [Geminicoccaceae bacterium]
MGLFDLPAPLFAWFDDVLRGFAPAPLRLALWGLIAAVVSMGAYLVLSPQRRITRAKADALAARRALDAYDGDFADAWPLIRDVLRSAFRQLALVTWPAILSSLPVLALLAWMSTTYGHEFPTQSDAVEIQTVPQDLEARLETVPSVADPAAPSHHQIVVIDRSGHVVDRVPWQAPVPTIHKREWWNILLGNPAGYLPDHGALERIYLDIPAKEYLPLGPTWLKAWYVPFFGVLLAASLAIKVSARIE